MNFLLSSIKYSKRLTYFRNFTEDPNNYKNISNIWRLCDDITMPEEVNHVLKYLKGVYETLATFNYPFESNYGRPLPAEPVNYVCQFLNADSITEKGLIEVRAFLLGLHD